MRFASQDNPAYYGRLREVLGAFRRVLLAGFAAVVLAGVGAAWNAFAFIPAAIAAVFACLDAFLVIQSARTTWAREWKDLLDGSPCRARDAKAEEYRVDTAVLPAGQKWHYIQRDFEDTLREAVKGALSAEGPRLVMLCGQTKAGKTRAAFQALGWEELREAWLLVPCDGASVKELLEPGKLPRKYKTLVVWLDDIERYASVDASGFHVGALRNLQCDRPVVLLATEGGRGQRRYAENSELADPVEQLRGFAERIEVPVKLTGDELDRTENVYGEQFAAESEQIGIGRRMVASDELKRKLTTGQQEPGSQACRQGVAVTRAAIDWRRMGAQSPLSIEQIDSLYRHYLPGDLDPSEDLLGTGMQWAREPLRDTEISLLPKATDESGRFEPYDLAVEAGAKQWPEIDDRVQSRIIDIAGPIDCFHMAIAAYEGNNSTLALALLSRAENSSDRRLSAASAFNAGVILAATDSDAAEAAYRRASERGQITGSVNLGYLLRERGDLEGAESAYRYAHEHGEASGSVNLGNLLRERGDLEGAESAYRRAEELGKHEGTAGLGFLLMERGDAEGAEAAWRRADERGNPTSAVNLGVLLEKRGDLAGAEAAYRRADERGEPTGAVNLGNTLGKRGDVEGAEAAYCRADERGDADGAYSLGVLLGERGDDEGAEAAYRRADERGDASGANRVGVLLKEQGDVKGAEAAYRRADERGSPDGPYNLGLLLKERGDVEGAKAACRRADERGSPDGAYNLGVLLREQGDQEGAEAAWRRADERGDPSGAVNLGNILGERGDLEGAEAAWRRADERGSSSGAFNLGILLTKRQDLDGAEAAWRRAEERGDPDATNNLALLLRERGDAKGAAAAQHRTGEP